MKQTPLKRNKGVNPISKKRKAQYPKELEVRKAVCIRCNGTWIPEAIGDDGTKYHAFCSGGKCEDCGKPASQSYMGILQFSHTIARSKGCITGATTEENCRMLCDECHQGVIHGERIVKSEVKWSKEK